MTPAKSQQAEPDAAPGPSKRDVIFSALEGGEDFKSAQDIHAALRVAGQKVGLATIYRILQQLTTSGEVDILRSDSGEATYRSCTPNHHHHLVCRMCGKTVEVRGPAVERWTESMAAQHGYRDVSHTVEIFGICADHAPS